MCISTHVVACDPGPQNQSYGYFLFIEIYKSGIWGCKKIQMLRKSHLKLSKWSA